MEADMEFVQKFTPPDFQAKNFTPSISPNFNSFSGEKTQKWVKMEKFTPLAKILHCRRHWRDGQIPPLPHRHHRHRYQGDLDGDTWSMIVHSLSWTAASSANQEATGPDRGSRESVDDVDEHDGDGDDNDDSDDDGDDNVDSDDDGDDTHQRARSRWGLGW